MRGTTLYNESDSVNRQDVSTKDYVDYVKTKVEAATKEYVEKQILTSLNKRLNSHHKHIIAVHASCSGKLEKDKYQFNFGGNTPPHTHTYIYIYNTHWVFFNATNRPYKIYIYISHTHTHTHTGFFLMPQTGPIKKIQVRTTRVIKNDDTYFIHFLVVCHFLEVNYRSLHHLLIYLHL